MESATTLDYSEAPNWFAKIAAFALLIFSLYLISLHSYLLFHSLVEVFSLVIGCGVFIIAWNSHQRLDNGFYLLLGIVLLCAGCVDLIHMLAYKGMGVFPDRDANFPTQLWIAARYLTAVVILQATGFVRMRCRALPAFAACGGTTLLLLAAVWTGAFPDCYVEGTGLTPFKIASEYLISLLFVAAIANLIRQHSAFDTDMLRALILCLGLSIAAELSFTAYASVFGFANMLGHLLRLAASYVVYVAVVQIGLQRPHEVLFRKLKQSEQALRESEKRIRQLSDAAADGIVFHERGIILDANEAFARLFGLEAGAALIGSHCLAVLPLTPESREQLGARLLAKNDAAGEIVCVLPSGARRVFEMAHGSAIWGEREAQMLSVRDVTESKLAKSALEQSEVRNRKLLDVSPDGIWIHSEGSIHYVNNALVRMLGYLKPDDLVGRSIYEFFPPEILAAVRQRVNSVLADSKPVTTLSARLRSDSSQFPVEVTTACYVQEGKPWTIAIVRDITERVRWNEALKQSEERYRTVANFTYDWEYWVLPDGSLPYISPSCEHISGYRAQEFMQDSSLLTRIVHPEDRAQVEAHLQAVQTPETNPEHHELDFRIITRAGEERWIAHACQHIYGENGNHLGRRASNRDITDRKLAEAARATLEAQLRESQKMEALGTLAGGVAHDFNNALASILGNVELARQDVGAGHEALVSLEEIGKASRRAKDLVQQILTFGRRSKLERKPTSLALVVVESARLLRATLPAKLVLNVDCEADAPAVLADAAQVKQILLNLFGNGLQAVQNQERPGVIEVRLEAHTVVGAAYTGLGRLSGSDERGVLRVGRYARLSVRDNGQGMNEETSSHIFEPFFTTKPKGKGTGLGLSVVHGIVRAHEASIEVESSPGEGSTFRIYFPAIDALVADDSAPAAKTAPADGRGIHVLYVDDEQAIVFLMKRLLERQGYRVSGYTDQNEALATARANPDQFDLAVTDYNMPGMSGLEVALALREIRPDLPVVMASGYIDEELRAQAPAAGIRELIYKPDTVDDLCEAVARQAQKSRHLKPNQAPTGLPLRKTDSGQR